MERSLREVIGNQLVLHSPSIPELTYFFYDTYMLTFFNKGSHLITNFWQFLKVFFF